MKKSKIFVLWYQGEKNAPDIVKMCISSMRRNCNGHEVIVLDNDNLFDWIPKFPEIIENKFKKGIFSKQLESDLIRYSLLSKYNCLWLDATVFVSQPIPDEIFTTEFFTVIRKEARKEDITGKISPFILGRGNSYRSQKVFKFCRDLLKEYIIKENDLINYLLVENIFYIAVENNSWLKIDINSFFKNKKDVLGLVKKLNDPVNNRNLDIFLQENIFNKLNFHRKYSLLNKNTITVFGKLKSVYEK